MKEYFVYIMTNFTNTTLYVGVTGNLEKRVFEHKSGSIEGFSSKYKLSKLVYCESTNDIHDAIKREKQLKGWTRKKKEYLINTNNPSWNDLLPMSF